jgi:hypothetical protein
MTQPNAIRPEAAKPPKLRRRDWILLPFLGLLTVALVAVSTEALARWAFSDSVGSATACTVRNDNPAGVRALPDSVCWEKLPEGELEENRFNSYGDRAGMEREPKPPGVYRIVMTGTSVAVGRYVPREKTFAALFPAELSQLNGRKVELYNESMMQGFLDSVPLRFNEILAARPDLILWVLTPLDIRNTSFVPYQDPTLNLPQSAGKALSLKRAWYLLKKAYATGSILDMARVHFNRTRSALMLRHFLYQSQSLYIKSYLMGSDEEAGYLKAEPSPEWKKYLRHFDSEIAIIQERSRAAGVPVVVVLVPYRAQAALISMGEWPAGYNPYRLDNELRSVVTSHGGIYIDMLPDFRSIPNPERQYFPVDGHPNAAGEATIARLLAKQLASGAIPELKVADQPQAAMGEGR